MALQKKNVIVFSFDDSVAFQKYKNVFNEPLQIPNLDRFCERSTVFHSAYCQTPICGPSRASFMSARTPHQLSVFENSDNVFECISPQDMWSYQLKQEGYFCSSGGKVHHFYKPLPWPKHKVLYSDGQKRFGADMKLPEQVAKAAYGGHRRGFGTTKKEDDHLYHDHKSADSAIEFLQTYDSDQPFYREIGFFSPHGPHYTPSRFKEMYNLRRFRQPDSWKGGYDKTPYSERAYLANMSERSERWWRCSVRNYFSALSHGDYHFGRIMSVLQNSPHSENTVVVLLSDHGFHLGNKNRFKKTTLWEQVASVPLVIFDPDQKSGKDVYDPVALIDVGPTVLDYAGLPSILGTVGRSLRPQVIGSSYPDRIVPTFHHDDVSVRCGDYRLIRYNEGTTEFYNLNDDYWQLQNLGEDHPDFTSVYEELRSCSASYGLDVGSR
ncbi:sulfatase-like hydrolase/transferase [Pseudopelagicola sp. nBUS_19]|uniref:sulfatase-like hydrolase/transferase n=1 Tax=Pseudopelagicola sp. nBUS_19 TaxID=3395316 RepID=UPI003EBB4B47